MNYIKGKFRNVIFESENGYKIGLFRIKETNDEELRDYINKTITFTGYFGQLNDNDTYIFYGKLNNHPKYGIQYIVNNYEKAKIEGKDAVIEFLSSSIIKGCGEKTAIKIVETLGENAIELIKENPQNLILVSGIKSDKAMKIYDSIMKYASTDELIIYLKGLGFSMKDSLKLIEKYNDKIKSIIDGNIYELVNLIDFSKLDHIYLNFGQQDSEIRILACILETMKIKSNETGDTYFTIDELNKYLKNCFNIDINIKVFKNYLSKLIEQNKIINSDEKYFLYDLYYYEVKIADNLKNIFQNQSLKIPFFEENLKTIEEFLHIKYNDLQKKAIKSALENNISIITGGPGTGKTTIIDAIVKVYIEINKLSHIDILNNIALLAPTGRASKRLSEKTNLPAMTIHRFLKWNKEKNEFKINNENKNYQRLVIVDEVSMVDTFLMHSLLEGLTSNVNLIFVGDENQLPSVGSGLILDDLIKSNLFNHVRLDLIYRQSANSYIPYLAKEIKERKLTDFTKMASDYNFIEVDSSSIKLMIEKIIKKSLEKGLNEDDIQVLIPMYKGENGIDNINKVLKELFNPKDENTKEYVYGDITFRIHDKVIELLNKPDCNIFNGDIGYICKVWEQNKDKYVISVNFDGNIVDLKKDDLNTIKHAYAITIHKSQGSEFKHIIFPIAKGYSRMLYNKLIYTGVSRAKKSLVIIGKSDLFKAAVDNDYSEVRKTDLLNKLLYIFK